MAAEFVADRVWVGVTGAHAGNVAKLVEDVDGVLPGIAGLGGVVGGVVGIAKVIVVGGLVVEVAAKFAVYVEYLFEVTGRLLMVAEVVVCVADAVEHGGLAPPVTDVPEQGQRLLTIGECLLSISVQGVDPAKAVERGGEPPLVAASAGQVDGSLQMGNASS